MAWLTTGGARGVGITYAAAVKRMSSEFGVRQIRPRRHGFATGPWNCGHPPKFSGVVCPLHRPGARRLTRLRRSPSADPRPSAPTPEMNKAHSRYIGTTSTCVEVNPRPVSRRLNYSTKVICQRPRAVNQPRIAKSPERARDRKQRRGTSFLGCPVIAPMSTHRKSKTGFAASSSTGLTGKVGTGADTRALHRGCRSDLAHHRLPPRPVKSTRQTPVAINFRLQK